MLLVEEKCINPFRPDAAHCMLRVSQRAVTFQTLCNLKHSINKSCWTVLIVFRLFSSTAQVLKLIFQTKSRVLIG